MGKRHFYMSPPKFFEIEYIINDWMDKNVKIDKTLAQYQWDTLINTYAKFDCNVTVLDPINGLPDLVFPGDAIFLYDNNVVASNFFHDERSGEVAPRIAWFRENGFSAFSLPNHIKFEGNADILKWGDKFLGGWGVRSNKEAYPLISAMLDIEIIPIKFDAPSFHLDVAIVPLSKDTLAYAPSSFPQESVDFIEKIAKKTIKISQEEAQLLGVNSMVVENTVILSTKNAPNFESKLNEAGFDTISLDTTEFYKSGGGVKCLTLEHYTI